MFLDFVTGFSAPNEVSPASGWPDFIFLILNRKKCPENDKIDFNMCGMGSRLIYQGMEDLIKFIFMDVLYLH